MLQRTLGLLGDVDLPFLEPLDQIVGSQIDELDGVGAVEDRVGDGLAHADMRDLGDDVVEALDVLNIDGGVDVDAVVEQLLDIEVALGMTAAGRVGMGELVHQRDLRVAGDNGVEIHLLEPLPLVFETPARDDLETVEQSLRLLAAMRFDDADHDIVAVLLPGASLLQHLVGLADAGSRADENLEPAGSALFSPGGLEQGLRRGSLVRVRAADPPSGIRFSAMQARARKVAGLSDKIMLLRAKSRFNISDPALRYPDSAHRAAARSSAKLSARTFTRGSPRKPRVRPSIRSLTS